MLSGITRGPQLLSMYSVTEEEAQESLCSVRVDIDVKFSDTQNAILKGENEDEFVENCRLLTWMKARQS